MSKILSQVSDLLSMNEITLRRWYVENVVLNPSNQHLIKDDGVRNGIPQVLKNLAMGMAPTPEHQGIAARMIYEIYGDRQAILHRMPRITEPKSWNQGSSMVHLFLWLYEPWKRWRWDPRSETVWSVLDNRQWSSHMKGHDSEDEVLEYLASAMDSLRVFGFDNILNAMFEQGFASPSPADNKMEASDFAKSLQLCDAAFTKFFTRTSATKELMDYLLRSPLMRMDTTTINCLTDLASFGNGVVPTKDIRDQDPEFGHDYIIHPAGSLIPADIEFMLGSATGLKWPEDSKFEEFVKFRSDIHNGLNTENNWDDWIDGAREYSNIILTRKCPTYKSFLDHTFPTGPDEVPEERDAFLRLLGAAVFGSNLKIVAAMIGAPNAGKDTVIKWLSHLLGNDQVGVLSPLSLTAQADDQRAFAPLKGARIAVVSGEVGEGRNTAILAEKVKSITSGGGTLTVAEKYEKPTTIFFDGMLIMQGNSVPTIIGGDKALYQNRLVAVEFKYPFPLQANSYENEYRNEAPHFLQVLFLSYCDYVERGGGMMGIAPPKSWINFSSDVEFAADPLAVIDSCLTQPDPSINIQSPVFYSALNILAERRLKLRFPMAAQKWAARLKKNGIVLERDKSNEWRTKVTHPDYKGWMLHFTLDADKADGFFTQEDWQRALEDASVVYNN